MNERIRVTQEKNVGRGYSAVKAWDDGKVYISIGRGCSLDDLNPVILIHDDILDIALFDDEARKLIDEWKEAKASGHPRNEQRWVSSCVKAMYKVAMKDPKIIQQVFDVAYAKGHRDGDRDRLDKIHAALKVL